MFGSSLWGAPAGTAHGGGGVWGAPAGLGIGQAASRRGGEEEGNEEKGGEDNLIVDGEDDLDVRLNYRCLLLLF